MDSSSHSLSSTYRYTGYFSISKSHQLLHMSDVLGQLKLAWIKMSLHTHLQISHDCSLLFGTDEISLATNVAVRSSKQLFAIVHALITKVYRYEEMYLSESVEIVVYIHTSLPVIVMFLIIQHHWRSLWSDIPGNNAYWFFAFFWLTKGSRNKN